MEWTEEEFRKAVIAQDDDNDYEESGYVAAVKDGKAYLASYYHHSGNNTFEALREEKRNATRWELNWLWEGPLEELLYMAHNELDPGMPYRAASPEDSDYDHLVKVYTQIKAKYPHSVPPRKNLASVNVAGNVIVLDSVLGARLSLSLEEAVYLLNYLPRLIEQLETQAEQEIDREIAELEKKKQELLKKKKKKGVAQK